VWVTDPAEKDAIVERYKLKLKSIDCKHFKFGDNTCPFGASCFYRHQYRDGTLEELTLRKVGAADGTLRVAKTVRLSDFLFPDLAR
jgi:E3 ubiquitin-protein ligase makorin